MKNNTVAIALGALLVGGVAMAGFINLRNKAPDTVAPTTAAPAAPVVTAPQKTADTPVTAAVPATGKLEYAKVLAATPVTESEQLYATVLGAEPVRESRTITTPREVCENVVVQERLPERDGNAGGTVAGALIGGLVGNQVGGGNGKKLATVAGAVAGGYIGNRIDKRHEGGKVVDRTERQCRTVNEKSTSSKTVAWKVTYRNPDGSTGNMRTDKKPGERIALGEGSKTIGYDVRYELNGQVQTMRMAQKPGEQLPVLDGQVMVQAAAADDSVVR